MGRLLFQCVGLGLMLMSCARAPSRPERIDTGKKLDSDSQSAFGLQSIFFDYKSSSINPTEEPALNANANILRTMSQMQVQIEGHCDSVGGIPYNLELGDRRARIVYNRLVNLGVSPNRMSALSFGKEQPLLTSPGEEAQRKNRRVNFVVTVIEDPK